MLQFIFIFDVILLYSCVGADNSTEESKCSSFASSKKNGMVIIFIAYSVLVIAPLGGMLLVYRPETRGSINQQHCD